MAPLWSASRRSARLTSEPSSDGSPPRLFEWGRALIDPHPSGAEQTAQRGSVARCERSHLWNNPNKPRYNPLAQTAGKGASFLAARAHTSRPEFVKITNPRKFLIEFFVQFAILHFPAIGVIILLFDGGRLARKVRECFGLSLHSAEGAQGGSIPPTSTKKIKKNLLTKSQICDTISM